MYPRQRIFMRPYKMSYSDPVRRTRLSNVMCCAPVSLYRMLHRDFYEKALFVKPTWGLVSVAEAQLLMPFALCFYPHFR